MVARLFHPAAVAVDANAVAAVDHPRALTAVDHTGEAVFAGDGVQPGANFSTLPLSPSTRIRSPLLIIRVP